MGSWLITHKTDPLWWNNLDGYTELDNASVFTQEERDTVTLPMEGAWIRATVIPLVFDVSGETDPQTLAVAQAICAADNHQWPGDDYNGRTQRRFYIRQALAAIAAMPKPRVLIECEGGLVQSVMVDGEISCIEIDWDFEGDGDTDHKSADAMLESYVATGKAESFDAELVKARERIERFNESLKE
jgi:hypothetical protein